MGHSYKISICMMVKNEEKNLERCLNSLNVFLNDPSIELIIVDTGSTDNTIHIAKKYSPKLYFHEWNNNFSEMRNISISYAKGEWIFIIDADECLENPNRAYELLMRTNIDKYNTIQLNVKSYLTVEDESKYSILPQPRLFRNDGTFRYGGRVHNQPLHKAPILQTDIVLGHYGYIASDKELMEKKFQRTATILKQELEKDPTNIYYQFQLSVSYSMYGDHVSALHGVRRAYNMIQNKPKKERASYVYMYGMYVRTSFKNNKLDETIKICKEGIGLCPDYIDLYFVLANALLKKGERSEAIGCFEKFIELYNNYDELSISKDPSFIIYNRDSQSYSVACINAASFHYDYERYEIAYSYLHKVEDKSYKVNLLCKTLIKLDFYAELKNYYDSLDDEDLIKQFTAALEGELKELDKEKIDEIRNLFKNNEDAYGLFNTISLYKDNKEQLIREFFNRYDMNYLPSFYGNIFKDLQDNRMLMFSHFKKINNSVLKQYIAFLVDENEEMHDLFYDYLLDQKDKIRNNDFQSNRVYVNIANVVLIKAMEEAKNEKRSLREKYYNIFNFYLEKGFNCLEYMYDMRKIRLIYDTLDADEDKFFMLMYLVKEAIIREDFSLAIKYIREALKQFPHMAIALQEYQKNEFKEIYN